MLNPLVFHMFFCYLTNIVRNIVKERIIARQRQLFKLWQMLTLHPHKHLENTNQRVTGNILIAFGKGGG
jgi:hypothetical protein